MASAGFTDAVSEARRLEKKLVEYAPYQDDIHITKTMDLEPRDYMDLTYPDMLNLYERNHKIISTAGMGILAAKEEERTAAVPAKTGEVENRLRAMTTETLQKAEEVAKEPIAFGTEAPAKEAEEAPKATHIEFEERPASEAMEKELEIEKVERPAPEIEVEEKAEVVAEKEEAREKEAPAPVVEKAPERPAERPLPKALTKEEGPKVEVPLERKVLVATVPPALKESPDRAAARRYEQMKAQIAAAVGESADEITLKKKMLELTKQLFKEKVTSKREEIKVQITVLKNMLASAQAGGKGGAGAKRRKEDTTNAKIFQSLLDSQQAELARTKDSIVDSYNKQVAGIKKKFYDDIATTEDPVKRKQIFEAFAFSVTALVEQLPDVLAKYKDFTQKKHAAEMEKLKESLEAGEKDTAKSVEERLTSIKKGYEDEFTSVKDMIARDIGNLIDKTGTEVLKKEEEKPAPSEAKAHDMVSEINETDEGTLLYYLHGKDPEAYKRYERKQMAKAEALLRAKQLMAKDRGLSDSMVKKFFG